MSVEIYNTEAQTELRVEYKALVTANAAKMLEGNTIEQTMKKALYTSRMDSLKIVGSIDVELPSTSVSEKDFGTTIVEYSEDTRKALWSYRRLAIRIALLSTILDNDLNKKKFNFRLQKSMESILDMALSNGKDVITMSQVVHGLSNIVGTNKVKTKEGELINSDAWVNDELALQFVNELAEQDILDVSIMDKIHMVNINEKYTNLIDGEEVMYLSKLSRFLNMNTVLVTKPNIRPDMISRSSWWYNTPELSDDVQEFVEAMNSIKYSFKADAKDNVVTAMKGHLKLDTLPQWANTRVSEFKSQIDASNESGGHHIAGKFDSSLRWYMSSDIGMYQTSKSLRSLTSLVDIANPIKRDFRNNVVQMYSILMGVKSLGKFTGLTDESEQLGDLRTILAQRMNEGLGIDTFNKDNTKPLFMIWAYNAGKKRLMEGVSTTETNFFTGSEYDKLKTPGLLAIAGTVNPDAIWKVWSETLAELVPSIVALKAVFNKLTKANPVTEASWTLPDGGIAQYASVSNVENKLQWVSSNGKVHTHTHYRKEIESGVKNSGLLPRIIHSFDAYVMRQLVIRGKREGIVIIPNHDSFIFDECHKDRVDTIVADIFTELLNSEAFSNVINEVNIAGVDLTIRDQLGKVITVDAFGDKLTEFDIRNGEPMDDEDM